MGFAEHYARATISNNLKCDEYHTDTDQLAASALSGDLGSLFFRVRYANDHTSYRPLLEKWREVVAKKAAYRGWPDNIKPPVIAELSLNHWINSVCPACTGKAVAPLPGVHNVMSDDPCPACEGTGLKPLICGYRERRYVEDMVEEMSEAARTAAGVAMNKLAEEMTL